jgi:hypothetical protein
MKLVVAAAARACLTENVILLREPLMTIFLIIFVSILLLILFIGVTIAGGRSHDRQNERRDNDG